MKTKVYLSDEGYGHIVRQSAILEEFRKLDPHIGVWVQTEKHLDMAKKLMSANRYSSVYNNITWHKMPNGEPDHQSIEKHFANYIDRSESFVDVDDLANVDFVLSDFVYEAFISAEKKGIPSFGVAHFTWDWFFSKLYPPLIESNVMRRFLEASDKATKIYFPPFTPPELIKHFGSKALQVPLIVRRKETTKSIEDDRFKILIIDSGSSVLKSSMEKAVQQFSEMDDILFLGVQDGKGKENVFQIPQGELLSDYIPSVDLVIGRAGFNTISECIAYRTPMLLLGESFNPEMAENIIHIKKSGLGSFMSVEQFESGLIQFLATFLRSEYGTLKENMQSHEMALNGAEVVAKDILNSL